MKKNVIIILLVLTLFLNSCAQTDITIPEKNEIDNDVVEQEINESDLEEKVSSVETEVHSVEIEVSVPTKPKYIFYIIGDGMGEAHLALGEIFNRIMTKDRGSATLWEGFSQQRLVTAGKNSASGGTALATGYLEEIGSISMNSKGQDMYTIVDRAKENGFATGVITNSYIPDATPAVFTAHAKSRNDLNEIILEQSLCDVDYLAGGGLDYLFCSSYIDSLGGFDADENPLNCYASKYISENYIEAGYEMLLGKEGVKELKGMITSEEYPKKLFVSPTSTNMLCQGDTNLDDMYDIINNNIDLTDLTRAGIGVLEQDEEGFVFIIEEALIDKLSHNQAVSWTAQEMVVLNETLEVIFDFYDEHKDETLIILTADHETGYYKFDRDKYNKFFDYPSINISENSIDITSFLKDEWDVRVNHYDVEEGLEIYTNMAYDKESDNVSKLAGYLTEMTAKSLGIYSRSGNHSTLPVPCYTHGIGAEKFADAESIKEISPFICELMGWRALPEAMPDNEQ